MELESTGHLKRKSKVFFTLPEFISGIIQEAVPEGEYQRRLETTATSIVRDSQEEHTLNFLPSIACSAVMGDSDFAIPITAAWQFIRLAAKLFDDVEDGESRDRASEVTNLATGYLFAAHTALEKQTEYGISQEQSQRVRNGFNRACLQTCAGQDVDLSTRWDRTIPTPDDWLEIARAKSGVLFAWASWAGAVVAGTSKELPTCFWEFGLHLGILVQIADDYNGIWSSPFKTDLSAYRVTLPISYADYVANHDERDTLLSFLREANQGNIELTLKGRDLISSLGAQKFILAAAQIQRCEAVEAISHNCPSNLASQRLVTLLDKTFPALVHLPLTPYETYTP